MAIQWSTTVRNARLNAIPATIGTSAILAIYGGPQPASCVAALGGATLLVQFNLASSWEAAASGGSMALNSLPLTATASGGGSGTTATFYQIYESTFTTCHEQGVVTETGGGGDLTLDNTSIANGQSVQITTFTKSEPGA